MLLGGLSDEIMATGGAGWLMDDFCKHLYISVFIAGVGGVQDLLLQIFYNKKGCQRKQKDSSARQKAEDVFKMFLFFLLSGL